MRDAPAENVNSVGTRSEIKQNAGGEKQNEVVNSEHGGCLLKQDGSMQSVCGIGQSASPLLQPHGTPPA
jgi:hypothetical protein